MHSIFFILAGLRATSAVAVVRRESDGAVAFTPRGDMQNFVADLGAETHKDAPVQFCRDSWPIGHAGTNACMHPSNQSVIRQQAECREAAQKAGTTAVSEDLFVIDRAYWMLRPNGCFAFPCATTGTCYYFNESPLTPTNISGGTPICKATQYEYGVSIANDTNNGCPANYTPVMDENLCSAAGNCLEKEAGGEFRTGVGAKYPLGYNDTLHLERPIGCYIGDDDDKVHYNFVKAGFEVPNHPVGTPICHVKNPTTWT